MKVLALQSIDFPKLKFALNAGEIAELPEDKEAQAIILAAPEIKEVKKLKDK